MYWLSALIGVVTALPSTALMLVGVRDACEETLLPYAWMLAAEEKDLLIRYGEVYRAYQQHTRAAFPKLGRWMGREER